MRTRDEVFALVKYKILISEPNKVELTKEELLDIQNQLERKYYDDVLEEENVFSEISRELEEAYEENEALMRGNAEYEKEKKEWIKKYQEEFGNKIDFAEKLFKAKLEIRELTKQLEASSILVTSVNYEKSVLERKVFNLQNDLDLADARVENLRRR